MEQANIKNNQILVSKYLPHNFLAEKIILSCLINHSDLIEQTFQTLPVSAFYFKNHQELYRALIFMHKNQISIEILTLITFLQDNGLLEQVGGVKVLIELISEPVNLIYFDDYFSLVKDKFIRRSLIKLGYKLINSGYITNIPLEVTLNELETSVFNLNNTIQTQKLMTNAELLDNIFFELKTKSLNPTLSGLASGLYDLDVITQGFQKSDLIIIAGRPSMGKTAFGLNIAANILKNSKLPVLFFSLEMSKEQIMYRLLAMELGLNQMKLKSGRLSQNEWIKLSKIIKIFSKLPFFIDDTFNLSVETIRSKIKTLLFEQNEIGLIIVDYIQLMQHSNSKTENRVKELSQITRSLKTLAREFNIPIIALSQLSRNVENRIDKRPILSDLRDSGSIEQDADLVILLYRSDYYNSISSAESKSQILELIIAKHRNGPTGLVKARFEEKTTTFLNLVE